MTSHQTLTLPRVSKKQLTQQHLTTQASGDAADAATDAAGAVAS